MFEYALIHWWHFQETCNFFRNSRECLTFGYSGMLYPVKLSLAMFRIYNHLLLINFVSTRNISFTHIKYLYTIVKFCYIWQYNLFGYGICWQKFFNLKTVCYHVHPKKATFTQRVSIAVSAFPEDSLVTP